MEAGAGGRTVREGGAGGGEKGEQQSSAALKWTPNAKCLELLLEMGIDRNAAIKGLYYTGNYSAEFAAAYVFDNPDVDEDIDLGMRVAIVGPSDDPVRTMRTQDTDDECGEARHFKMVFVVNSSLGMGPGKIAAHVAHAAIGLYRRIANDPKRFGNQLSVWEEEGEKKVVLRGEDDLQLLQIERQSLSVNLETFVVRDTEGGDAAAEGADTVTLLGIFGRDDITTSLTGNLPSL